MVEKLFPDFFLKNQNWEYFWANSLKFYTVCFYQIPSWVLLKCVTTKLPEPKIKPFQKTKIGLELISLPHFLHDFWRKIFLLLYYITLPNLIARLLLLLEILGNMYIVIVCWPGCDIINFEFDLAFLIKPFFFITKKSRQKFKYLENKKIF